MEISPDLAQAAFDDVVRDWLREDVRPAINDAIGRRWRHIPTGTEDDFRYDLLRDAAGATGVSFSFRDESRMADMKTSSMIWRKRPITTDKNFILGWARRHGRRYFKNRVPGYKDGKAGNLSEDQKLQRFASAIIASYDNDRTGRRRRGAWYNKTINLLLEKLEVRFSEALVKKGGEEMVRAFQAMNSPTR